MHGSTRPSEQIYWLVMDAAQIGEWLTTTGLKIGLVLLVGWFIKSFGMALIERVIRNSISRDPHTKNHDLKQREDTLIDIFHAILNVAWWIIVAMLVFDLLGVNIGPLIAGAGVAGVALGFGGQWLVRDLIAGTFIVIENQYRVGDAVELDTGSLVVIGKVEEINLRMTMLRDLDGKLHHVPNGAINVATNLSKGFSGINLNINISQEENLEKVIKLVNKIGTEFGEDPDWKDKVLDSPQFLRVDDFVEGVVVLKITGKTLPLQQWAAMGELRKRIKLGFDKAGVDIAYPQRVIHEE